MSGFPFSTMYVASSAARPVPTFLAEWIVPAGMKRTSPALTVTGEVDAAGSHLLRLCYVERQAGCGEQRRDCHDSSRVHVDLPLSCRKLRFLCDSGDVLVPIGWQPIAGQHHALTN